MPGETLERELQYDLRRARRPLPLTLDQIELLQKTADIQQKTGEFWADRIQSMPNSLTRGDYSLGEVSGRLIAIARGKWCMPVGCSARHHLRSREIGPKTLAGLELMRLDQRPAVGAFAARQPDQRAFRFIDFRAKPDIRATAVHERHMLRAKAVYRCGRF